MHWRSRGPWFEDNLRDHRLLTSTFVSFVLVIAKPLDVIWGNLDVHPLSVLKLWLFVNIAALSVVICMSVCAYSITRVNSALGAVVTVFFNALLPSIMEFFNTFEPHDTKTSSESSLFLKLTISRATLYGFLLYVTTSWSTTLATSESFGGLSNSEYSKTDPEAPNIRKIVDLLIADAILSPLINAINIPGNFQFFFLSTRAKTEASLLKCFRGTTWSLAERYSDMTKVRRHIKKAMK